MTTRVSVAGGPDNPRELSSFAEEKSIIVKWLVTIESQAEKKHVPILHFFWYFLGMCLMQIIFQEEREPFNPHMDSCISV